MKDRIIILLMFAAVIFGLPMFIGKNIVPEPPSEAPLVSAHEFPETVCILLTDEDRLSVISGEEYLTGCLCAQIPINYSAEALKAQASATATYALKLMETLKNSSALPPGADISDDPTICQPYFDEKKRKEHYGSEYEKYADNIASAVKYGLEHIITYQGEPIHAVYHPLSAGRTCPSEYIWNSSYPYLRASDSPWDETALNFECTNEMTSSEAWSRLLSYDRNLEIPVDCANWFTEMNVNEDGYVISVNIGDNTFSGGDIWRIFGLRSTAFTVTYQDGIFTFTTKGAGHCAGMSQYGANELARSGRTAEEILRHYYGDEITI